MERIAIDTIGPLPNDMGFKYIIVIIHTFTRYVELFPKQEVLAIAAADALWRHTCRFTAPLEIVTVFGSQFMNQLLILTQRRVLNIILRYLSLKRKTGLSNVLIRRSTGTYVIFSSIKVILKIGPDYFV